MDANKDSGKLNNGHLITTNNENCNKDKSCTTVQSPKNADGNLFTFRSTQLPGCSRYNGGVNTTQNISASTSNACSRIPTLRTDSKSSSGNKLEFDYEPSILNNVILNTDHNSPNYTKDIDDGKLPEAYEHNYNTKLNAPSTSGLKVSDNVIASFVKNEESRKRPSSLNLNKINNESNDSSSDTGNDEYSLGSEDGCIYTYRGGEHLADLPSSFFSLDMGLPHESQLRMLPNYIPRADNPPLNRGRESRASSPDMDFLEMDFDPDPSCEADTGDESCPDPNFYVENPILDDEELAVARVITPELDQVVQIPTTESIPTSSCSNSCVVQSQMMPSTSRGIPVEAISHPCNIEIYGKFITHINNNGDKLRVRRTTSQTLNTSPVNLHNTSGDLVSPRELLSSEEEEALALVTHQMNQGDSTNMSILLYHLTKAKKLLLKQSREQSTENDLSLPEEESNIDSAEDEAAEVPKCMVWSELEACERQVTQIGTSACGATAVINVFLALGVPVDRDKINAAVGTRQRANNAPLPRYLLSRSVAGCTAADLMMGINKASEGQVTARFFPTYPERAVSLSHWLADWINIGAIPILTLNLQNGCTGDIPDAWHHQMVFGVSPRGVYLCNPLECINEEKLWIRLASPSTLLVRARDVLLRFTSNTDLTPLAFVPDRRYHTFNVLGQVVNLIHEWRPVGLCENTPRTKHIKIPAAYQAGITVAALTGTEAHRKLMQASQLPILAPQAQPRQT